MVAPAARRTPDDAATAVPRRAPGNEAAPVARGSPAYDVAAGTPDPAKGVREFIVSTGGESHGTPPGTAGDPDTSEIRGHAITALTRVAERAQPPTASCPGVRGHPVQDPALLFAAPQRHRRPLSAASQLS